ncbi:platelet-activating factor acetylhydrolase [Aphelenchoides avenae]|nr:platelet-activating factor acetylhydrolase [Aphelenchus avenae]
MGIASSTTAGAQKPTSLLPIVGCGRYEVGCADIMIERDGEEGDTGVFFRIFYPSTLKVDPMEPATSSRSVDYPLWRPRKEYLDGLAQYRQMSPRKMHFFFDWVVGERRVPAGWHEPLYTTSPKAFRHSQSADDLHLESEQASDDNGTTHRNGHLPSSQSEHHLRSESDPIFPVLLFSHGISGNRLIYSTLCASLASYGFVVAAIEHRDRSSSWTYWLETDSLSGVVTEKPILMTTFPDGETEFKQRNHQLHKRVAECVRTLHVLEELNLGQCAPADKKPRGSKIVFGQNFDWTQFKGRLDISKAATIGHSFGGAVAVAAAAFSTDFQASVVMDGWFYPIEHEMYSRTSQPALMINAQNWQWKKNVQRMLKLDKSASEKIMYTFKDIVHQSFSDFAFLMPGYVGRRFNLQGELDPLHTAEAYMELTVNFLRKCFHGEPAQEVMRETAQRYADFVLEGTDLDVSEEKPPATPDASI